MDDAKYSACPVYRQCGVCTAFADFSFSPVTAQADTGGEYFGS